jgi:hypothetical protein
LTQERVLNNNGLESLLFCDEERIEIVKKQAATATVTDETAEAAKRY